MLIIAILPYLYISMYCNPIADDFTYAFKIKNHNFFSVLLNEYLNWNGRYISNIFVILNPIAFDSFLGYKFVPIFLIFLTVYSIYYFIRKLTNEKLTKYETLVFALVLTLLYLYQMPIISEGIYWYTGAVTYQLGNIFLLFYLGILSQFIYEKYIFHNRIIHLIILILSMFLTVGFNEILMIIIVLLSLCIYLVYLLNRIKKRKLVFYLLIASICFGSIVYFAPGNLTREAFFPDNHNLINSFIQSIAQSIRFFFDWISSAPIIFISILYFKLNRTLSENIPLFNKSFYLSPVFSFSLLFFIIFIGAFPAYWSTGILGQHRTINTSYFLFLLIWFINLTVVYNQNLISFEQINKKVQLVFLVIIWCSLVFTKNGYNLFQDIRTGDHKKYNDQMVKRYSIIEESSDTIYFEPIKNRPATLFVLDITDNPKNWQNLGYAIFFNKPEKSIILKSKD